MDFVCPSCKSESTQRLSVIYEGGLSDIKTKSKGSAIGFGRGGIGIGFGSSKTSGIAQTAASQRATPPSKKRYMKPLLMILGAFMVVSLLVGQHSILSSILSVIWIVSSVGWIYYAYQYNSVKWPPLKSSWDDSCLCNRCNAIFVLGGN